MSALIFGVLALLLVGPVPTALSKAEWPHRAPRAALVLWQAVAIAAVLSAFSAGLAIASRLLVPGADGRPTQKSLREVLTEWVGFRQTTVRRRTEHRLAHVNDHIHILEGRQLVLLNIDEVIRIIRESDEPKAALIARFNLSDRQAEDILEIRLRQLARLEAIKIEQDLAKLRDERAKLEDILSSPAALRRTVIKEIEADAKQYGDDRRTLIQAEKRVVAEVKIVDEPVTVIVSQKGWVRALKGHEVDVPAQTFKAGDALWGHFRCRSVDPLIVVGSNGRVYSVPVSTLPGGRGDGQPITTMIELESGTQIAHYVAGAPTQRLVFAGSTGYGLLAQIGDLVGRQKAGKTFLALDDGEQPLLAAVPAGDVELQLGVLSAQGRLLTFPLDELKHQPKGGKGLMLMDLEDKDTVASVACFTTQLKVLGSGRGGKPREELLKNQSLASHAGKRARKGKAVEGLQKVARLTTD